MNESLLQASFGCGVGLGCQTHEAVLEDIGLERFVASDHDVDSQVILVATQEMGFREVLGDQVALALVDGVLLANNLDAPSATSSSGLENVHVFKIIHLAVVDPALVVLRENVSGRTQLELFAVLPPLFLHVPPQVGLATHRPRASKMVELLVLVHELQLGGPNESCPQTVPRAWAVAPRYHVESCRLQSIHYAVVGVRLVAHSKSQTRIRLQSLLRYNLDALLLIRSLHLQKGRVAEEDSGLATRNGSIVKNYVIDGRTQKEQILFVDLLARLLFL